MSTSLSTHEHLIINSLAPVHGGARRSVHLISHLLINASSAPWRPPSAACPRRREALRSCRRCRQSPQRRAPGEGEGEGERQAARFGAGAGEGEGEGMASEALDELRVLVVNPEVKWLG